MGGKASVFLVLGFSLIFIVAGNNFNNFAIKSTETSADYYNLQVLDNIANSGINYAISSIRKDANWQPDTTNKEDNAYFNFGGGSINIRLQKLGSVNLITATTSFRDRIKMVEVKLEIPKFSEFGYFSDQERESGSDRIWWHDTDTVWGPFHTNDDLNVAYKPWFLGNKTSYGGDMVLYEKKKHDKHAPHVAGHLERKTIDYPTDGVSDLADMASTNGAFITNKDQVFIEFDGDSIKYKFNATDEYTTILGSDFAPNNTIFIKDAELHIQGKVSGNWSIGNSGSGTRYTTTYEKQQKQVTKRVRSGWRWSYETSWEEVTVQVTKAIKAGNIYLDDDITYNDDIDFFDKNDPSNDLLGIIAKQDVLISDNTATKNINIHAAIYCEEGGFGSENYNSRSSDGTIYLKGGISQKIRRAVGTFSGSSINSGFSKNYRYDARLQRISPPSYPDTKEFKVTSWLDTVLPDQYN